MQNYDSPLDLIRTAPPMRPVMAFRPARLAAAGRWFADNFPGDTLYAVKANPAPHILDGLWAAGIRCFDVASEEEAEFVHKRFPEARLAFMHPVKNRQAIARAYHFFGCRTFVLDTADELQKILDETLFAKDLTLVVRLAVTSEDAVISLSGKFGVGMAEAPGLLRQTRAVAARLGISFHGGSQCMMPGSWNGTMLATSMVIKDAGVPVDIIDVGGGFPSIYPGMTPRGLDAYINIIKRNHDGLPEMKNTELWCEPGRALVAESESLITRIEQVRPGALYINDGGFGALFDAVRESWRFPVRAIKAHGQISGEMQDWFVHGPTCDPVDALAHPIALPANLVEGDYIEFGNLGAYGSTMASRFNGFGRYDWIETHDAPWDSLYPASVDALGTGTA